MANDNDSDGDRRFSFATRELRRAERPAAPAGNALSIAESERERKRKDSAGFDPYNSSGSFDRKKNWERVRKR
ncbi:MAG TPA: hypothetical protein VME42_16950 [Steroidobacteraceae bacterium]|nr:hypothetical protein [Steroidobacteraceae bacterium]